MNHLEKCALFELRVAARALVLLVVALVLAGCEQLKEEYVFWNETPEPIRIGTGCLVSPDETNTAIIEPGAALTDAYRPVALPDEPFIGVNHEAQFKHNFPTGVIVADRALLVDEAGRGKTRQSSTTSAGVISRPERGGAGSSR